MEQIVAGPSAPSQNMTGPEIVHTMKCLGKVAHSLMGIHEAMNTLSSARQAFASDIYELERAIFERGTYATLCEDPISGRQTYTVDAARRKGLLAAAAFLEILARADEGLAYLVARVSRNIHFGLQEYQLNNINGSPAFHPPSAETSDDSKTGSKAFKEVKNVLLSSMEKMKAGGTKTGKNNAVENDLEQEAALRTLTRDTKNIESLVIERGIAGIVDLIFTHMEDPTFLGDITQSKDSCIKWLREFSEIDEYNSERCMSPLDTGNLLDAAPKIATTTEYSCEDHSTQVYPSVLRQMENEDTVFSGTPSEFSNISPPDTTLPGTSSSAQTAETDKRPDHSYYEVEIDDESEENTASPRKPGHKRTRSVHTVPFMSGSGTATTNPQTYRRPQVSVVYEENGDDVSHNAPQPKRSRAYTIAGTNGGRPRVNSSSVNASYRFPNESGGSSWLITDGAPIDSQKSDQSFEGTKDLL